jgi:2'-5' RNA ligase
VLCRWRVRLFIAVDPAREVRERIARAARALYPRAPAAKWAGEAKLHLTLAFLGETDAELIPGITGALRQVACRHTRLSLHFQSGGCFGPPRRPRILWAGVAGDLDRLSVLQREVESALEPLGYPKEARRFCPHLTLARAREVRGDPALSACAAALTTEDFGQTTITSLILYRSDRGPHHASYTALEVVPLGGEPAPEG